MIEQYHGDTREEVVVVVCCLTSVGGVYQILSIEQFDTGVIAFTCITYNL
jgi:hypothetical protein